MKTIILLISLATVLTAIVVAQDDGKAIQNLRSFLENADQQSPEDDKDALVQNLDEEKQLEVLKSLLATAQDDEDFDLNSLLADTQDDDDDLESLLAVSQDDDNFMKKLLAGEQDDVDEPMVTTQDEDEDDLAQNRNTIANQLSANKQNQDLKSSEQDEGQAQWYSRYARYYQRYYMRYYSRYYSRYYNRYYSRYYSRYYGRYYKNRYIRYYSRYYNRYYSRYWQRYYRRRCYRRRRVWG